MNMEVICETGPPAYRVVDSHAMGFRESHWSLRYVKNKNNRSVLLTSNFISDANFSCRHTSSSS